MIFFVPRFEDLSIIIVHSKFKRPKQDETDRLELWTWKIATECSCPACRIPRVVQAGDSPSANDKFKLDNVRSVDLGDFATCDVCFASIHQTSRTASVLRRNAALRSALNVCSETNTGLWP